MMANRFSEQLDKIVRGSKPQMGFGKYAQAAKPRLFIMAEASGMVKGTELPGADAVVVAAPCRCETEKSGMLRGCAVGRETEHSGCDFIVLDLDGSIIDTADDMARLFRICGDLSDGQLRALGGLDAAAFIAEAELGESLVYRDLLFVQRLTDLCGKPLLLRLPVIYNKAKLQALWDRGITGIVVDANKIDTAALRNVVDELEPKKRGRERAAAIVSSPPATAAESTEAEPDLDPDEAE
ncbi:hypothetical protein [Dehalogenimonas sp. 4OHTPN]|uniref:CO dehydrogenase/acetyl-CoA synthase delta subunit TIM barrel domain-containing protein n=1 Tax=Dehalogenimonas sp. 4OHTPN TaxID=3166643 RepID=A0AAU8GAY4_9CHLR